MPEWSSAAHAPPGSGRRVVAVVVSWRQADQLAACLEAIDAQTHPDLRVVVVDNAGGDGSLEIARDVAGRPRRHPVTVAASASNRGFAGGVHDGLRAAGEGWDAVWLVNVDAVPAADHLERLVGALWSDDDIAAVQGTLVRSAVGADGVVVVDSTGIEATRARLFRDRDEGRPLAELRRAADAPFGVTGACALLRRDALADVAWSGDGPWTSRVLTEDLFAYFDDVDLAWRLQRLGWRCRYVPEATATHERGGAGPRRSSFVEELNAANRLLVLRTCDGSRRGDRSSVAVTTGLKAVDLLVSHPTALVAAARRVRRGWAAAGRRRRELDDRARVSADAVVGRWFVPLRWGPWVAVWWRRVRGHAAGVATRGGPRRIRRG